MEKIGNTIRQCGATLKEIGPHENTVFALAIAAH